MHSDVASSSRIGEHDINRAMAVILNELSPFWKVMGQPLGTMKGRSKPDIVIENLISSPIIIETEIMPAVTVEKETRGRLGLIHYETNVKVNTVMAVRLPKRITKLDGKKLINELSNMNDIEYAIYSPERYPYKGWLRGNIRDVANALQVSAVPSSDVNECVDVLESSMLSIGDKINKTSTNTKNLISKLLNQPPSTQTWKMAGLILSNAMLFHDIISESVDEMNKDVRPLAALRSIGNVISQKELMDAWDGILEINYAPIFEVALDIMSSLSGNVSSQIIQELDRTVSMIQAKRMTTSGDMYGVLFQRLIADRDKLATYYTRPESAALIAALVVPGSTDAVYKSDNLTKISVADFACGTGLLLSSVYRQIIRNYGLAEYDIIGEKRSVKFDEIHTLMMERCLIGLDVIPIATHLTVSALAMMFPRRQFDKTKIKTMPIGLQNAQTKSYRLGSLDLIQDAKVAKIVPDIKTVRGRVKRNGMGSFGKVWSISDAHHQIKDESCDIIVMNPPFVRPTNQKGKNSGNRIPPWAAFDTSDSDQTNMSNEAKKKFKGTCANGGAGLASNFAAVCNKKIKNDGTIALIMPATISGGSSWEAVRCLLRDRYKITVISIANYNITLNDASFSSDTGMAEIILIAEKLSGGNNTKRGRFVSLRTRPRSMLEASEIGRAIKECKKIDVLESGQGGSLLKIGKDVAGAILDCPINNTWKFVNVVDPVIEQIVYVLHFKSKYKFVHVKRIARTGPISRDITADENGRIRGPFTRHDIVIYPEYPALWNNRQETQTTMTVMPDTALTKKPGASDEHVKKVWDTASRVHVNINPRYTANRLIASFLTKKAIGGATWPSILIEKKYEKAFVVWCNSSFGVLTFWSHSTKQQLGRGRSSPTSILDLLIPDFSSMGDIQIKKLSNVFEEYQDKKLDLLKNLWKDPVRIEIDNKICSIMEINFDVEDMRNRLCLEPSISGGNPDIMLLKKTIGLYPTDSYTS